MRHHSLVAALVVLGTLGIAAAQTADKPKKEGSFGQGGGAILTKEQLRSCINQKARDAQRDRDLTKEQAALAAAKDEIGRGGDALKSGLETLDRSDAEAVAAYNHRAQERDQQIDDYEARASAFNASVEAAKGEREAFSKACDNRRFLEEDEIAIRKGK
jgi:hypothetical protein